MSPPIWCTRLDRPSLSAFLSSPRPHIPFTCTFRRNVPPPPPRRPGAPARPFLLEEEEEEEDLAAADAASATADAPGVIPLK